MPIVARLNQYGSLQSRTFDEVTNTDISVTGFGTFYSSEFIENVGLGTTAIVANTFRPYDITEGLVAEAPYGPGTGQYMSQQNKKVTVYNEIDETTDFYGRSLVLDGLILDLDAGVKDSYVGIGTTWADLSFNQNNALIYNTKTYSTANGGYLEFNSQTFCFIDNPGDIPQWTLETFVRFTTSRTNKVSMVVGGEYDGVSKLNFTIGTNNAGLVGGAAQWNICVGFYDGSWHNTTGVDYALNTWFHIVGTYDGSVVRQFTNGTQVDSLNYVGTPASGGKIRINRRWDDVLNGFNTFDKPNIGFVRIYNRALTATEISNNYNASKGRFGL